MAGNGGPDMGVIPGYSCGAYGLHRTRCGSVGRDDYGFANGYKSRLEVVFPAKLLGNSQGLWREAAVRNVLFFNS